MRISQPGRGGYSRHSNGFAIALACVLAAVLAGLSLLFLTVGARDISMQAICQSFTTYDPDNAAQLLVRTLRLPRLLAALLCGAGFAVSGALMQGVTNNPMASPSILGVNAGAGLGLAVAMIFFPDAELTGTIFFSFAGAAVATFFIMAMAFRVSGSSSKVYLTLAGMAIGAIFSAITQALVVFFDVAQDVSYWTAGGISSIRMTQIAAVLPWVLAGFILALFISKSVTLLTFGEEVAIGLGGKILRIRVLAGITVLLLSGAAVAVAGPVGFIGLVTPHMARYLVGIDYRKVVPIAALLGAILVVAADMAARLVSPPFEMPLGAVTALIGVPFFLYLANRKGMK